jgi:dihydrodipicolinate synthase/N-acetylneuraminate lyase
MSDFPQPPQWVIDRLHEGLAIPAHPLALTEGGEFDLGCQRALTRYYAAAGAGGLAVGVHTTQFEIRRSEFNLLRPVLQCAAGAMDEIERGGGAKLVRIAGICGRTQQATEEAKLAASLGYHAGLLSLAALGDASDDELIRHCQAVGAAIPLMGFYLQPAVGGRRLSEGFWRRFAEIPSVVGVKMAPFNRYQTLDVVRGVCQSSRRTKVALYTGNDDNIVADLLTPFEVKVGDQAVHARIVGGLLGHWAVWTQRAAALQRRLRQVSLAGGPLDAGLLTLAARVTECNAALFDVEHDYTGCIAGIQYVLHRQGLLASTRCLSPRERLSPGQADAIDRVRRDHADLIDDDFVHVHRAEWLS